MYKLIISVVLCVASASAWADRILEVDSNGAWGTQAQACRAAKQFARGKVRSDEHLVDIGECDCERANEAGDWSCSVQVTISSGAEFSVNGR